MPLDANGRPDANALPGLAGATGGARTAVLYLGPDTWVSDHRQTITEEALRHHLPVFTSVDRPIKDSAVLMGLVAPYFHMGRFTAFKAEI